MKPGATQLKWTRPLVAALWRHYAEHGQETYFTHQFGDQIVAATRKYIREGAVVCDYGCGSGHLLALLAANYRTAGVDFTAENVAASRARAGGNAKLMGVYQVGHDDLPEGAFDVLYVVETVEHVLEDDLDGFFADLCRLLRPGGRVIVTTPHDEDLAAATVFCPCCTHTFHRWQHLRSFTAGALEAFMRRGGFEREDAFTTDFSARSLLQRAKAWLRPRLGRKNPHLVYVGRKAA